MGAEAGELVGSERLLEEGPVGLLGLKGGQQRRPRLGAWVAFGLCGRPPVALEERLPVYSPFHSGLRLAKKASTPSLKSFDM